MPQRIQRKRTPGWRLTDATTNPLGAVIVSRPSRFGNPFTIKDAIDAEWSNPHSACASMYGEWLRVGTEGGWFNETYRIGRQTFDRQRVLADLHELRGKDLACWCALDKPCHADELLKLANAPEVR